MSVVLPAPLSPTRPTTSPFHTWKSTFLRAWTPEYHLCRPRASIKGASIAHISSLMRFDVRRSQALANHLAVGLGLGASVIEALLDCLPDHASCRQRIVFTRRTAVRAALVPRGRGRRRERPPPGPSASFHGPGRRSHNTDLQN